MSFTFGPFRLDERAGELRRNDQRVPLTPKVFQLLLILLENPRRLIPKQELLDKVWGDTHVAEGSVTRAITRLRSALNDNAARPQYVETVPRRGYRFVATIQNVRTDEPMSRSSYEVTVGDRRFPLIDGENVLGRADDCEVSLKLDSISRRHAVITVNGTGITVRDLRSKNGTFVQGRRIDTAVELRDGDQIRLGPVALTFKSGSGDPTTVTEIHATQPPASKR